MLSISQLVTGKYFPFHYANLDILSLTKLFQTSQANLYISMYKGIDALHDIIA